MPPSSRLSGQTLALDLETLSKKKLGREFYARPVLKVARDCIGKVLVHNTSRGLLAGRIVEAEAYRGPEDRAAHSFGGRRTRRTEAMFGPPGYVYMFIVYGIHEQFNIVVARAGEPQAVLIRAIEPISGVDVMCRRRQRKAGPNLTNGPGKLCQAFGLSRRDYGRDLTSADLFLADAPRTRVSRSARIGIDYARQWAVLPWRFFEAGNAYVSTGRPSVADSRRRGRKG